jgi:SAM-dependent methyltransferase
VDSILAHYVCPACRGDLERTDSALTCRRCGQTYPIGNGIADFVREDSSNRDELITGRTDGGQQCVGVPAIFNLLGGGGTTLAELTAEIAAMIKDVEGRVLDAACGRGNYGRRVASARRSVFGIDISLEVLRQARSDADRDHVEQIGFARARVEALPFRDAFFDAALCCGCLHLFPEPVDALREVARTMKPKSTLAAVAFTRRARGIPFFRRLFERLEHGGAARLFEIPEMAGYLDAAGFEDFRPTSYGSILVFRARRQVG